MDWILRNDRDKEIEFHISLSPTVKVDFKDGVAELSRGDARIQITGLDHADAGETPELAAKLPAGSSVSLKIEVSK